MDQDTPLLHQILKGSWKPVICCKVPGRQSAIRANRLAVHLQALTEPLCDRAQVAIDFALRLSEDKRANGVSSQLNAIKGAQNMYLPSSHHDSCSRRIFNGKTGRAVATCETANASESTSYTAGGHTHLSIANSQLAE